MDKIWILNFFLFSQGLYFLKVALKIAFNINVRKKTILWICGSWYL